MGHHKISMMSQRSYINWKEHAGAVCDSVDGFSVIECTLCRFKHIVPLPESADLERYYTEEFYDNVKPNYFQEYEDDQPWWELVYNERYQIFEAHLPDHRRRIVDIGCGPGFFLQHGQKRGWEVKGVEPSPSAAQFCQNRGVPVLNTFFHQQIAEKIGQFDVVMLDTVLEHIPNARDFITRTASILSPGGLICVTTANDYNPLQHAVRQSSHSDPWWVIPGEHINYFNFNSLTELLQRCGFEIILSQGTFPMELFLLMGDHYVGNHTLGRQCHEKRKQFELLVEQSGATGLKQEIYRCLARHGISREVVLFARKPDRQDISCSGECP